MNAIFNNRMGNNSECLGILTLFILLMVEPCSAEVVKVGLEPLPPLITVDKKGSSIKMFREIEEISELRFKITIIPYSRAKYELKNGRMDLIGHTPYQAETEEFYSYAQELDWSVSTKVDIYAIQKTNLDPNTFKNLEKIGTPSGNETFFSELYGIPIEHFHTGGLENLLKMLTHGRIDLFLFERSSTMTQIQKIGSENIYYRNIDTLPASFAVRKDKRGDALKQRLENLITKLGPRKLSGFEIFNMPASGVVKIKD